MIGKVILLASLALLSFSGPQPAMAEGQRIVLLTEENPPFNYRDPATGDVKGSSVDLVHEIMSRAGVDYEIQVLPWRRAFRLAQEQPDTCLFSMNFTKERAPLFKWVTPFYRGGWAFYQREGDGDAPDTEADIKGRVLVAQTATGAIADLERMPGVEVIQVGTEEAAYELLQRNRADYWLAGLLGASHVLTDKEKASTIRLVMHWRPAEVGMGCSPQTDDALVQKLNDANDMLGDKRYAIIQKHF